MIKNSFKKASLIFGAFFIIGACIYFLLTPFIAMYELKVGLDTNDQPKLNANIDFPVLRSNLKEQINDRMFKKSGIDSDNPVGSTILGFGSKFADVVLDNMVTPENLSAIFEGKKHSKNRDEIKEKKSVYDFLQQFDFKYESLNQFSAQLQGKKKTSTFILERRGLSWKLVNVILPD